MTWPASNSWRAALRLRGTEHDKIDACCAARWSAARCPASPPPPAMPPARCTRAPSAGAAWTSTAAMTPDTVVWIASMTKAITGAAALQQVEAGRLSLDAPIGEVLPELAAPAGAGGFDAEGTPRLRPAQRADHPAPPADPYLRLQLRHLERGDAPLHGGARSVPGIIGCQRAALTTPLVADPGERWEYGIGIDWAGRRSRRSPASAWTTYWPDAHARPARHGRHRLPHRRRRSGRGWPRCMPRRRRRRWRPIPFEVPQDPEFHMGGGGLY